MNRTLSSYGPRAHDAFFMKCLMDYETLLKSISPLSKQVFDCFLGLPGYTWYCAYRFSVYKVTHCLQAVTTFTSACGGQAGGGNTGGSKHSISYKPYVAPPDKPHDLKNMELKRPMSPHLTIYAPTLTAMTSIVQRITGVIVLSYALLLSAGTLFLSNGVETYVSVIQSLDLSRPSIVIIKILLGAPFVYHYFNGIRYCAWNAGKWLSLKEVYGTAKKSFVLTGIFTLLFAFL